MTPNRTMAPRDATDHCDAAALARVIGGALHDAPVGLLLLDAHHRIAAANRTGREILGVRLGENLADRLLLAAPGGASRNWKTELENVAVRGNRLHVAAQPHGGNGEFARLVDLSFVAVFDSTGAPAGILVLAQDVTRQNELERRVTTAESLAAVGKLAARVAHELNNPLDGALRYLNLAARKLQLPAGAPTGADPVPGYLEQARQGLLRMARIIGDLLEFSRSAPQLRDEGNVNAVIEEAIRAISMAADEAGVSIAADFHDDADMPALEGTRLFQVCCNLMRNAIDAMPDGGMLTISSGLVQDSVIIRFADTGVGLPAEAQRIFEPFYTTKSAGKGTGLGLAICKEYVEKLGGSITAEEGKEKGSVFTLRIPLASCKTRPIRSKIEDQRSKIDAQGSSILDL